MDDVGGATVRVKCGRCANVSNVGDTGGKARMCVRQYRGWHIISQTLS